MAQGFANTEWQALQLQMRALLQAETGPFQAMQWLEVSAEVQTQESALLQRAGCNCVAASVECLCAGTACKPLPECTQ